MDNAEKLRNLHDRLLATGADYSDVLLDAALELERLRKEVRLLKEHSESLAKMRVLVNKAEAERDAVARVLRCDVTLNRCGTDTVAAGKPCNCLPCTLYAVAVIKAASGYGGTCEQRDVLAALLCDAKILLAGKGHSSFMAIVDEALRKVGR